MKAPPARGSDSQPRDEVWIESAMLGVGTEPKPAREARAHTLSPLQGVGSRSRNGYMIVLYGLSRVACAAGGVARH
jgi:hypothetical protein